MAHLPTNSTGVQNKRAMAHLPTNSMGVQNNPEQEGSEPRDRMSINGSSPD
jgi:hypothetical protein